MDIKELAAKAVAGEDISEDKEKLTEEELVAFSKEVKSLGDAELARVTALRKEGDRVSAKNTEKESAFIEKSKNEQLSIAKEEFFSDPKFALSPEEKTQFEEEFKKIDSGSIAKEFILKDLKKAFALVKADDLISSKEKSKEFEKNAEDYNAFMAGGMSSGGESGSDEKYSNEAKNLFKDWQKAGFKGKTLDDAQKMVDKGSDWKKSTLAD